MTARFAEGDRVWHRQLGWFGVYQGRRGGDDSVLSPANVLFDTSYVLFDDDGDYPDGRQVTTDALVPESEVAR